MPRYVAPGWVLLQEIVTVIAKGAIVVVLVVVAGQKVNPAPAEVTLHCIPPGFV